VGIRREVVDSIAARPVGIHRGVVNSIPPRPVGIRRGIQTPLKPKVCNSGVAVIQPDFAKIFTE